MVVVEIQKQGNTVTCITTTHTNKDEAEQKYHQILSYAAVSAVEHHSATLLDDYGTRIKGETYHHLVMEGE